MLDAGRWKVEAASWKAYDWEAPGSGDWVVGICRTVRGPGGGEIAIANVGRRKT